MQAKRVLLISPITLKHTGIENFGDPAIGIHRIAAYLRDYDQLVEVYDSNVCSYSFESAFQDRHFDIIGISILANTLIESLEFVKKLRGYFPKAKIIAGGIEASLNYQTILDNSLVDAVALAEGEDVMLEVCEGKPLGLIKGLVVKNYAEPITNERLWKYWSKFDFTKTGQKEYWNFTREVQKEDWPPVVRLVTSSHCNRKCTFCSTRLWHQQACGKEVPVAYLSPEQIEILLVRIKKQLPETKRIYFCEDQLLVTKQRAFDLIPVFKKFDFEYLVQTSTWMLTEEIVKELAQARVVHITCGVENASAYVRKTMGKPQDEKRIEDIIDWCHQYGVRCYYLIILFPAKTRMEDLWINYKTLTRWMKQGVTISIEPYEMLYRGSLDYDSPYDFEYKTSSLDGFKLKEPTIVLPEDPQAREAMFKFRKRWPEYRKQRSEKEKQNHFFKGATGKWMVSLLGELLNAS